MKDKPHADYRQVHLPKYQKIQRGEREGWSDPEDVGFAIDRVRDALAVEGAPAGGRLLELGCGDGCITVELARLGGFEVHGVDIVELAVDLARQRLENAGLQADLQQANVVELPWPDEMFDVLVDSHCFHCIVLDDRRRFLAEARRVLKPGGMLVIMTMAGDPPPSGIIGSFDPETRLHVYQGVAGRHFGKPDGILDEVRTAGFAIGEHWLYPRRNEDDCDELVVAALRVQ